MRVRESEGDALGNVNADQTTANTRMYVQLWSTFSFTRGWRRVSSHSLAMVCVAATSAGGGRSKAEHLSPLPAGRRNETDAVIASNTKKALTHRIESLPHRSPTARRQKRRGLETDSDRQLQRGEWRRKAPHKDSHERGRGTLEDAFFCQLNKQLSSPNSSKGTHRQAFFQVQRLPPRSWPPRPVGWHL